MYRSGLVDTLFTHANTNGVWPNFLVWSLSWLYASSVKNKTSYMYLIHSTKNFLGYPSKIKISGNCIAIPRKRTKITATNWLQMTFFVSHVSSALFTSWAVSIYIIWSKNLNQGQNTLTHSFFSPPQELFIFTVKKFLLIKSFIATKICNNSLLQAFLFVWLDGERRVVHNLDFSFTSTRE